MGRPVQRNFTVDAETDAQFVALVQRLAAEGIIRRHISGRYVTGPLFRALVMTADTERIKAVLESK
jgi:hypothetical protein